MKIKSRIKVEKFKIEEITKEIAKKIHSSLQTHRKG